MQERDLEAEQALARARVDELYAFTGESRERDMDIVDLVGDVVHPGAALGEELADRGVGSDGCEQLDAAVADEHGRCLDALVGNGRAVLQGCAEKAGVGVEGLVEVVDGDAEVMNAACVHPGDANEGSASGEELEPIAEGIRSEKPRMPP